ncbi:MAG TPA: 2-oxo acid dehydrogenase subunit E2 [Spirillospora sp.]|nr:2-oxo acid dehydrogenase subunit E2 [Spirillospora sp.]
MAIDILVPQIGEAVSELTLVQWLKAEGDTIRKGDVLFEIDSDKAIVEVEAYVDGTLGEILAPAGSTVMPQQVVGRLQPAQAMAGDVQHTAAEGHGEQVSADEGSNSRKISPVAQRMAAELGVALEHVTGSGPGGRITADDVRRSAAQDGYTRAAPPVNASPKARQLAKARGVDLRGLTGTGVAGMIVASDVQAAVAAASAETAPPAANTLPLTKLRRTIAARTLESKQTVPHFYLMVDVHMGPVNDLRRYCREKLGWERPPTYTDVLIRACGLALADMPEANRSYSDSGLITRQRVNIGVAVSTHDGLIVPVIPNADQLNLRDTSAALRDLAGRAREGRLRPGDVGEKSMVISNLGMYAVDTFIAIIDLPDPMILAVGRVTDRVVPVNGQVVVQPMCTLSLSVDHRVLDGVQAAQFLERIKDRLEYPYDLMGQASA